MEISATAECVVSVSVFAAGFRCGVFGPSSSLQAANIDIVVVVFSQPVKSRSWACVRVCVHTFVWCVCVWLRCECVFVSVCECLWGWGGML